MKNKSCLSGRLNTKAFTLIELLVVVLVIGILAAVALPQYQKAVVKSRTAQLYTLVNTLAQAAQSYKLANGNWPESLDELDIDLPLSLETQTAGNLLCGISVNNTGFSVGKGKDFSLILSFGSVIGVFTEGKYQCAGLAWREKTSSLYCIEIGSGPGRFQQTSGDYCSKIMQMPRAPQELQTSGVVWFQ